MIGKSSLADISHSSMSYLLDQLNGIKMISLGKRLVKRIHFILDYYVFHKADPVSYLRAHGAVIGDRCDLLGGIKSFGTETVIINDSNEDPQSI